MSLMLNDIVKVVNRKGIKTSGFIGKIIDFKDNGYGRDKLVKVEFIKTDINYKGYMTNWYLSCHLILIERANGNSINAKKDNPVKEIKSEVILNGSYPIFKVPEGYTVKIIKKDFGDFGKEYPEVVNMMEHLQYTIESCRQNNSEKYCSDIKKQLEILEKIYVSWELKQPIIFSVEKEVDC